MSEWFSGIKAKFILDFIADQRWKYITDGLKVTLEVTFLALILGLVLGAVIAVIRTTHDQLKEDQSKGFGSFLIKLADLICRVYLTVIRGTPTMVQLLIMFFIVLASSNNKVMVAVITFGVNSGAYVAEIFRSGIMSVDKGQMEAGRSVGLIRGITYDAMMPLLIVAVIYLVIVMFFTWLMGKLERRLRESDIR
ncbi:MAG: ABC transporter permease subunit [Ruminococcus sp.]|nr:ABC transporter permease subunit [Ruminococcus sp.]